MYEKLRRIREEKAAEDRGFTLIELLVVVVIIGILVAIAIPLYLNYQDNAHKKSVESDIRNGVTAVQACVSDNGTLPATSAAETATFAVCPTENMVVSSGNTLTYTNLSATHYTILGSNSSGSFTYDSDKGTIS